MRRLVSFAIAVLLLGLAVVPVLGAFQDGKQIVFIESEPEIEFTSVIVQGTNQLAQRVTWSKQDPNGFSMAYTKDWWWSEDFIQISFILQDYFGNESSMTCLIDVLQQPSDSPRVVVVYSLKNGCVGGEAGSALDPVLQSIQPMIDGLNTIDYYLPENKFDLFMQIMYNELNATGCVLGLSSILYTRGYTVLDDTAREYITQTCQETAQMVSSLFPSN